MKIITFLSDFGYKSSYVAQMKAIVSRISDARIIDITHDISAQNIMEGSYVLYSSVDHFPDGTVHVAVVDPGVGTSRKGIVITTQKQVFIGPDNGLLIPAARKQGDFIVYSIDDSKYVNNKISNTFHGRDIFAPVAAHITNGVPFDRIGIRTNNYVNLDFGRCEITPKSAYGEVIFIDDFGNIITNIDGDLLLKVLKHDSKIMVFTEKNKEQMVFVKSYNYVKKGSFLATIGSSDLLEIDINQANAAKKLKIKIGDKIKILF